MVKHYLLICLAVVSTCLSALGEKVNLSRRTFSVTHIMMPFIGIRINGGVRATNSPSLTVEIKSMKTPDNLITEMQVGTNADLSGASWQPYSTSPINIQVEPGDGAKIIYARLKDKAGNLSPIESNRIILDTKAPQNCKLVLNKGEKFTNDRLGRVLLNAFADEATEMMVSNSSDFGLAKWERYVRTEKWILDLRGNGEKTVYAKFRDQAGNESEVVSTTITLDTSPPSAGSIVINDGEKYTNSRKVTLQIQCEDAIKARIVDRNRAEIVDFKPDANGTMKLNWLLDSIQGQKDH